ncbi:hypothetical protein [Streptomyces acidiscabies]|uniref:Uncharacterized protein n=1 Tax=Streptomyces acidiscabies TaxID=42234 RepID=A0AAP6BBQ2_9ACTN|nr:hypothetical protein [Streptomyces acidiscabies]MBP5942413.1 hypothetical protein [Streptomyces sp. LBUM 1476]MBZ3917845.1 hypothetical protein [Streptomyces acidiscabies]MDX2961816.1 hypothetical protein [Streptomyces acidiscabies]MDX3023437.1 hypothetical protein [Streptomyces acidiscabies]MDX3789357.1 hypothetical protein [Streptomyces acidiscabies]
MTSEVVRRRVVVATILTWASVLARAPELVPRVVTPAGAVTASRTRSAARRRARYAFCRQAGRS